MDSEPTVTVEMPLSYAWRIHKLLEDAIEAARAQALLADEGKGEWAEHVADDFERIAEHVEEAVQT